ncbi:MAG: hypothetical protein JXB15_04785 [Anaerolineales bacterium]|nr:hypothetical protein [Anaerolineales bacterium]
MSVLERIAYYQNRRDEVPNQELARELAETRDAAGIQDIAENLRHKNPQIQSDCLKVLYEIGYLAPELIAGYASDFLKLLRSRNNRLVWGGMIALSTIAEIAADEIYAHLADLQKAMQHGSVITVDAGIMTLAKLACTHDERRTTILPILLEHLRTCRPKDVPQHAEKILPAVDSENRSAFIAILETRLEDISAAQAARIRKVIKSCR